MSTSQSVLSQVRRALLAGLLLAGLINLLALALPLYALHLLEGVIPAADLDGLALVAPFAAGALLVLVALEAVRGRILLRAGLWCEHTLGQHTLRAGLTTRRPPAEQTGDAQALSALRQAFTGGALVAALDALWVPLLLAVLAMLQPLLAAITAGCALLMLLAAAVRSGRAGRLAGTARRAADRAQGWRRALETSGPAIGALGLAPGAAGQWERLDCAGVAGAYAVAKRRDALQALAHAVRAGSQIAVLGVGAWLAVRHQLTLGALIACALLDARALGSLQRLLGSMHELQAGRSAYRRIKALPNDVAAPVTTKGVAAGVVLTGVTCYYPGLAAPALDSVSLTLSPGRTLAVTGAAGAGKSTLAAVLAGALVPSEGTATLDGVPIAHWQRGETPRVGYLPDEPLLLEGSVHANIARFREASLLTVSLAAMRAGLHETLCALPQGYDTPLGPGGAGLSWRERRGVALVRALFGGPELVVLDEPELGLDGEGVRRLARMLDEIKREGASVVIATRHERLLELADEIVTLEGGTVAMLGPRRAPAKLAPAAGSRALH